MPETIFDLKFYYVAFGTTVNGIRIQTFTCHDLRRFNRGYADFVRRVLANMAAGRIYQELDDGGDVAFYVPAGLLEVDGVPLGEGIEFFPWLETWKREGDDMPCPSCGEEQIKTQDKWTCCYACGWQAHNPLAR